MSKEDDSMDCDEELFSRSEWLGETTSLQGNASNPRNPFEMQSKKYQQSLRYKTLTAFEASQRHQLDQS
jgi:hypothetical protein